MGKLKAQIHPCIELRNQLHVQLGIELGEELDTYLGTQLRNKIEDLVWVRLMDAVGEINDT